MFSYYIYKGDSYWGKKCPLHALSSNLVRRILRIGEKEGWGKGESGGGEKKGDGEGGASREAEGYSCC